MNKRFLILILTFFSTALVLTACKTQTGTTAIPEMPPTSLPVSPTPAPPLEPTALISEVLAGVDGNNNFDFIELANPGQDGPFNLQGMVLVVQVIGK